MSKTFAILVGGGPAPGINSVISSVGLEALSRGHKALGVAQGFERLIAGDSSAISPLEKFRLEVSGASGGSILGTSRANPKKDPADLANCLTTLEKAGVDYLVSIGGDDTASSAAALAKLAGGKLAVAHVPKTIDNDLPLPELTSTFGFQTAREEGTKISRTLLEDARTTGRWYLLIAMGRKAGHLALGIGLSSGAPLTIIPEEFSDSEQIEAEKLTDMIVGSILKRQAAGQNYGVAVLAEGLAEKLSPDSCPELASCERDPHGHIRFAELDFGGMVKRMVIARMKELGLSKITVVEKNVGYELRCCRPTAFDLEYTRSLGFSAVDFLLEGKSGFMAAKIRDELRAILFEDFIDPKTSRAKVRLVETSSSVYRVARSYQDRLATEELSEDFASKVGGSRRQLAKLALD